MDKFELPVYDTIINTFNVYGSISSIISNQDKCLPWFYNNFIQIRYVYDWNTYFFDNHHLLLDNCPWINHHVIPKFIIENKWDSIIDFIIDSIKLGNYVYLYVDRFYISASKAYLKKSRLHEIFIYGYDMKTREFYVADNLADGKYIRTVCTFTEIEQGYTSIDSNNHFFLNIHLLSLKEEDDYFLNIPQITKSISNYLDSAFTTDVSFKERTLFGQNAILFSVDCITEDNKEHALLDKRAFHLFWEHKQLMLSRIKYLIKEIHLSNVDHLVDNYKKTSLRFEVIRNMALKYNLKKDQNLLSRIRENIKDGLREEKLILENVLEILSK